MSASDIDRSARLNTKSFLVCELFQSSHNSMIFLPIPSGSSLPAIDNEFLPVQGNSGIKIVSQHA